jgi:hypothetical protein
VAGILAAFNLLLVFWGVTQLDLASTIGGYDFSGPFYIGVGVLVISVLLFLYRRAVEDKKPITFRDRDVPVVPSEDELRLLREEVMPDRAS